MTRHNSNRQECSGLGQKSAAATAASVGSHNSHQGTLCTGSVMQGDCDSAVLTETQLCHRLSHGTHLMRQAAGVIRDYGKVVQGVQESDTSWHLIRVSPKGQGDITTIYWHCASVHHHKTYTLAAVDYDSTSCSPTYTETVTPCPLQECHTRSPWEDL